MASSYTCNTCLSSCIYWTQFFSCREVNDFACFLVPQVHLVNLYYPYAKHVGVPNPFGNQIQLTSLEKVLKTESNGYDVNRKNVIIWGVLSVTVISAEYLPPMYIGGKADPFVVLYLKRWETKKKTRVIIFPNLRVMYVHFFQGSHNSVLLQVVTGTLNPIWNQTFDSLYKMHCMICSWWNYVTMIHLERCAFCLLHIVCSFEI